MTLQEKIQVYLFDYSEWFIFAKRLLILIIMIIGSLLLWLFPLSLLVAPFYSATLDTTPPITKHKDLVGKTTLKSVQQNIQTLLDEGLVTNFTGVNLYIDNKFFEQVGQIEMIRIAINTLENNLARNRGTGGANRYLVQARSDVYADYKLPVFTSYTTRLKQTSKNIDKYLVSLADDDTKPMNEKEAVFIVNSDNLAEVLDKLKQQLQTNAIAPSSFFTHDDKFYHLKGNLIAMHYFLSGIDFDFKTKLEDKTSYQENFIPLLASIKEAIAQNHWFILESLGHVSKLEKEANIIAQKLGELRDKLKNG